MTTTIDNTGANNKKKRTRHDIIRRRPGIVDADQSNKIRLWKEQWLASGAVKASMEDEEEGGEETATAMMQRQRQLETKSNISASQFGNISVKAAPADILGFQQPPSLPLNNNEEVDKVVDDETSDIIAQTPSTISVTTTTATTTTTTTTAATTAPANKYYPLFLFDFTKGTCTNNGHEPPEYTATPTSTANYMFTTKAECCSQWYVDATGCYVGFAYPDSTTGMLLRRNEVGDELPNAPPPMMVVEEEEEDNVTPATVLPASSVSSSSSSITNDDDDMVVKEEGGSTLVVGEVEGGGGKLVGAQPLMMGGGEDSQSNNNNNNNNNNNKYYPSLDMKKYPNGACPNDGNIPLEYQRDLSSSSDFIFDNIEECCVKWFIDVEACIAATATTATTDDGDDDDDGVVATDDETANLDAMMAHVAADTTTTTYVPSPFPTFIDDEDEEEVVEDTETPWPTWSDAFVTDDIEKQSAAETFANGGGKIKGDDN
jgi:hypothetical protein